MFFLAEKRKIIKKEISYEGVFDSKEIYNLIYDWFFKRMYIAEEPVVEEVVKKDKKYIFWETEFFRSPNEYVKFNIVVDVFFNDMKEVKVEYKGRKATLKEGKVKIEIEGEFITDFENKYEGNALSWYFRIMFEKFLFRPEMDEFQEELKEEVRNIYMYLKKYFNLQRDIGIKP